MTGADVGRGLGDRLGCMLIMLLGTAMLAGICLWEFGWWAFRHIHVLWS